MSHVVIWPVTIRIIMALRDREGQMYPDILTNYMQYYNNNECIMCKCYPDKWKDKPAPVIIPLLTILKGDLTQCVRTYMTCTCLVSNALNAVQDTSGSCMI